MALAGASRGGEPRRDVDRQDVGYLASASTLMPRSWKSVYMAMRIFVVVAVDAVQVWGLRPVRGCARRRGWAR
jgi:hypothetical protein